MTTRLRNIALICALPVAVGIALASGLAEGQTGGSTTARGKEPVRSVQRWAKVSVDLPVSQTLFPPGDGADLADGQCLICHSADMVLRQPPLTQDEWAAEINKMRTAFGAPLPADQVDTLARYLSSINSRRSAPPPPPTLKR